MAASSFARAFPSFECRSDPDFSRPEIPNNPRRSSTLIRGVTSGNGMSSLLLRFPPKFVRQLSNKARRNCGNIGVAQVVAASWSDKNQGDSSPSTAKAIDAAALAPVEVEIEATGVDLCCGGEDVQIENSPVFKYAPFLNSDGSIAIHAGERLGRGIATDAITTPVVNTSAYFFKKTADLIDFK